MANENNSPSPRSEGVLRTIENRQRLAAQNGERVKWGRGFMLTPSEESNVLSLAKSGKYSLGEIAKQIGTSRTTISRTIARNSKEPKGD